MFSVPGVEGAYDNNMINPDLTTWTTVGDAAHGLEILQVRPYGSGTSTFEGNMFQVSIKPSSELEFNGVYVWMAGLADGAKLVPGNSYTVSFYLPCGTDIWKAIGEPEGYKNQYYNNNTALKASWTNLNAALRVGISYGSSPNIDDGIDIKTILFEISSENVDSYFGQKLTASFVCPDFTGNAYLTFAFTGNSTNLLPFSFYFSDVSLIDPNDSSAELKGIKWTLHNFYWDIVGGACGNEDCPHCNEDNPHISIIQRLFVPSDEFVESWKSDLQTLLQEHLGVIYSASDFIKQLVEQMQSLLNNHQGDIKMPALSFSLPDGTPVHLWNETTVDFAFLENGIFKTLYGMYKVMLNVICIFALIKYAIKNWEKTMAN